MELTSNKNSVSVDGIQAILNKYHQSDCMDGYTIHTVAYKQIDLIYTSNGHGTVYRTLFNACYIYGHGILELMIHPTWLYLFIFVHKYFNTTIGHGFFSLSPDTLCLRCFRLTCPMTLHIEVNSSPRLGFRLTANSVTDIRKHLI